VEYTKTTNCAEIEAIIESYNSFIVTLDRSTIERKKSLAKRSNSKFPRNAYILMVVREEKHGHLNHTHALKARNQ
jgi:hypothetical protein